MTRFQDERLQTRKQMLTTIGSILGGAFALYLVFFIIFAQSLKSTSRIDTVPDADAIVVFTGTSPARIEAGLELLAQGKGQRLLVSGVYQHQDFDTIMQMAETIVPRQAPQLRCCVDLDYRATNTVGNTQETALWADVHGFKSLIVVTSSHHMPRAFLELRRTMPTARLSAYPVVPPNVRLDYWFAFPGTLSLLLGEYSRYLWVLAGLPGAG